MYSPSAIVIAFILAKVWRGGARIRPPLCPPTEDKKAWSIALLRRVEESLRRDDCSLPLSIFSKFTTYPWGLSAKEIKKIVLV